MVLRSWPSHAQWTIAIMQQTFSPAQFSVLLSLTSAIDSTIRHSTAPPHTFPTLHSVAYQTLSRWKVQAPPARSRSIVTMKRLGFVSRVVAIKRSGVKALR